VTPTPTNGRRLRTPGRRLLATALALLVCAAATAPVGAAAPGAPAAAVTPAGAIVQQADGNVTVPPHTDPDAVATRPESDRIRGYVAALLAERLGRSVVHVERGEYERARGVLGDDYDGLLSRYVEVTGDDGDRFREARDDQRRFVDTVESYESTSEAYREARGAGDTTEARSLARDLTRLAVESEGTVSRLTERYAELETETGVDFDGTTATVERIGGEIVTTGATVREREFVPTTTRLTGGSVVGSFSDPIRIDGVLAEGDGTPVADRRVAFAVGRSVVDTTTGSDGSFSLAYRPVAVPAGPGEVTVRYLPAPDSIHLGSTDTAAVDVAPVTPSLAVDDVPRWVAYGDRVQVGGTVTVDGTPVPGANVSLWLGESPLGDAITDGTGRYVVTGRVHAAVPTGRHLAVASLPGPGLAVGAASGTAVVDVTASRTTLTLSTTPEGEETVRATGRLTTLLGVPVSGQPVALSVDGTDVRAVTTSADGTYVATVPLPTDRTGTVGVAAAFAGAPNLDGASAAASVDLGRAGVPEPDRAAVGHVTGLLVTLGVGADADEGLGARVDGLLDALVGVPVLAWLGVLAATGVVLALVRLRVRGGGRTPNGAAAGGAVAPPGTESPVAAGEPAGWSLSVAHDRLATGSYAVAIEAAYRVAREHLAGVVDIPDRGTHREFLGTVAERIGRESGGIGRGGAAGETGAEFGSLTARYERATYGPWPPTEAEARSALVAAESVVAEGNGTDAEE
jgi:hypothetical protein